MRSHERKGILAAFVLLSSSLRLVVAGEPVTQAASGTRIDYIAKLNELVKKGSDESQNAEPFYRKAFTLYVESPTAVDGKDIVGWPTELTEERHAALKRWVETNSEALVQLRLGTEKPAYWFQYRGDRVLMADRSADMSKARSLLWALLQRAKFEAADGNAKDAVDDVMAACRFAVDMRKKPLLVDQLVGLAASAYALRAEYQILDRIRLERRQVDALRRQLTELSDDRVWSIDLGAEKLAVLDLIQSTYAHDQDAHEKGSMGWRNKLLMSQLSAKLKADAGMELTPEQVYASLHKHTAGELMDLVERGYTYYNSVVSKTPFQWKEQVRDFGEKQREFVGGNLMLLVLLPAVGHVSEMSSRGRAERDALITVLGLLSYRDDKAGFPAELQDLVSSGCLPQLPMDPYSDKPLVYKRTENSFVLYSVGADFQDNGGRHDTKWGEGAQGGDFVFWPVQNESPGK